MFRPVVKRSRIAIGAARPHKRVNLAIERNRVELREVTQRAVEFALENGPKIDCPDEPIPKLDAESVWPRDLEPLDL